MKKANVGHPKGLYVLFLTEMWERFSYYGMRAMFVLYMVKCLSLAKEDASQIYGNYTGLEYLTPLLRGYLADSFWGNRRSILLGSAVMALGQFLMFVSACIYTSPTAYWLMFAGLGLLILGNGFFKPNISTMVGDLYAKNDSRRDSAYTIFYMGVNVGAMIAPLWCGFVSNGESPEGFKWSFLSAAVGMLIGGLVFYFFKDRYLHSPEGKPLGVKPEKKPEKKIEQKHAEKPMLKAEERPQPEPAPAKPEPKMTGNAELDKMIDDGRKAIAEMKRLDDNIPDEKLSAQIRRLEEVSGQIFQQVKADPQKLPQIRRFMNYYLPTTLKILNAYDRMGEQGVAGENITSTMHKVESMMATIITAFEKQLDNLFGAEAMDISTDMVVLENMMAREGLTDDPLHRTAAASAEDTPEDGGITPEL